MPQRTAFAAAGLTTLRAAAAHTTVGAAPAAFAPGAAAAAAPAFGAAVIPAVGTRGASKRGSAAAGMYQGHMPTCAPRRLTESLTP